MGFLGERLGFLGLPRVVIEEEYDAKYVDGTVRREKPISIKRGWPKEDGSGFGVIEGLGALDVETGKLIIPSDRLDEAKKLLQWGLFPEELEPKVKELTATRATQG